MLKKREVNRRKPEEEGVGEQNLGTKSLHAHDGLPSLGRIRRNVIRVASGLTGRRRKGIEPGKEGRGSACRVHILEETN